MKYLRLSPIFAAILLGIAGFSNLHATVYTWTTLTTGVQDGSGNWAANSNNWWDSVIADPAWSGTDIAVFGYGNGNSGTTGAAGTVTLTTPISAGGITFQNVNSGSYTIASANSSDTLALSGTVSVNGNYNPTISANVSGSGFTIFDGGPNGFTLSGTNNYTGTLLVTNNSNSSNYFALFATEGIGLSTAANLEINDNDGRSVGDSFGFVLAASGSFSRAIGTGADQIQFLGTNPGISANGAPLVVNFGGARANITWGSAAFNPTAFWLSASGLSGGQPLTLLNGIDLNGATRQVVDGTQDGGPVILAGGIVDSQSSGAGIILNINRGTANMYLSGTSTYTGTTSIQGNSGCMVILGGTGGPGTGGTGSLASTAISIQNGGPQFGINLSGTTTLGASISGSAGTSANYNGNTLIQYGPGTVIYTGSSNYSGGTLITNGVMQIGNGTTAGSLSANSAISGSTGTVLAFDNSGTVVVSNTISGGLGVSQIGTGNLTLVGNNLTYTGTTTVTSGTLQLGNGTADGVLPNSLIAMSNSSNVVFDTISTVGTYTGNISGAGNVTKNGIGTLTLSGSNGYTGTTTVASGTLKLVNAKAVAATSNITVSNGGNLSFYSGAAQTFTLANTTTMTLANGSALTFGIGNGTGDQLVLSTSASVLGTVSIDLTPLAGANVTNFEIIKDTAGGLTSGSFTLASLPPSFSGSISEITNTGIYVTFGGITTVYWKGGTSNSWSTFANFTSNQLGTTLLTQPVSSAQSVIFSANGAANEGNTILGGSNIAIQSLTVNDTKAVGINGTNTLTVGTLIGGTAIEISAGAGATTIGANLAFASGNSGLVEVDSTNGMTISGTVSGNDGLTMAGTGLLALTGSNTFTGGVFINSGTLRVNSDNSLGDPSNNVTFSGSSGDTLQLAALSGTLTSNRNLIVSSGTGNVDTNGNVLVLNGGISGPGVFNLAGLGRLIENGTISTPTIVTSGTLTLVNPVWAGGSIGGSYTTSSNGTLELNITTAVNLTPNATALTFAGDGTLLVTGTGDLQLHWLATSGINGSINMNMTGGLIDLNGGLTENGGISGNNSPTWTNNLASLEIDSGATFNTWDGSSPIVDALIGSGTITRLGYGTGANTVTIGINNGSGNFSGVITNAFGVNNIVKTGTGIQVFSGNNSYTGTTMVNNGTLKITNNNGLGFGGPSYDATAGVATVTGSTSTLDLSGVTVNKVIALSGGSLINSNAATGTVIDNGIAQLELTAAGTGYTAPSVSFSGTGSVGVSGSAGIWTGGNGGDNNLYVYLTSPGSGYTVAPTVTVNDPTGSGATATAVLSSVSLTGSSNAIGGAGDITINAVVSDGATSGGFTKVGNDAVTLTANNTYSGDTTVDAGTLNVGASGSITGSLNVMSGGTAIVNGLLGGDATVAGVLDGSGTIAGPTGVTVLSTGTLRGTNLNPTAFLNVTNGSINLTLGATYLFTIDSHLQLWSYVNVASNTGVLNLNGATLAWADVAAGPNTFTAGTQFQIANANGGIIGSFSNVAFGSDITIGTNVYQVDMLNVSEGGTGTADGIFLTYEHSIPEPRTWAMLVGGVGMLIGATRIRRQRS